MNSVSTSSVLPKYEPPDSLKILIVDDSPADAFLFRQLAEGINDVSLEFSHCLKYSDGLQAVLAGGHDIAFVDCFLGPESGPELIAAAGGRLCPTPLVLLTGKTGADSVREAIQAGAVDFVDKMTLSSEILRRVIRYARYNHNTARELALSQERYRHLAEAAIEANSQKSRFFAEMSHELRTPLNAIIGFSEIMKDQMLGTLSGDALDRYLEYTHDIHASSRHLLSLINDLLDMSKMEAGQYPIDRQPVSIYDVADDLVKMVRVQAEGAGIHLELDLAPNLADILADRRLLLQSLLNVVSNALKFTEPGGTVRLEGRVVDEILKVTVRDTGCGIPPEELEAVLLPYRQGSTLQSRPGGGTGLGLTLTKSMMELQGGGIAISSDLGVGTAVDLLIPFALTG